MEEFSGRSDPEWRILSANPNYQEIEQLLSEARRDGLLHRPDDIPSKLGFKGFIIEDTMNEPQQKELIVGPNTVRLQLLLLQTMPEDLLTSQVRQHIETEIRSGNATAVVGEITKRSQIPLHNHELWNHNHTIRWSNNCYNYATNKISTEHTAQPGRGSGREYARWRSAMDVEVREAAIRDGLVVVGVPSSGEMPQAPPYTNSSHLVALSYSPLIRGL